MFDILCQQCGLPGWLLWGRNICKLKSNYWLWFVNKIMWHWVSWTFDPMFYLKSVVVFAPEFWWWSFVPNLKLYCISLSLFREGMQLTDMPSQLVLLQLHTVTGMLASLFLLKVTWRYYVMVYLFIMFLKTTPTPYQRCALTFWADGCSV